MTIPTSQLCTLQTPPSSTNPFDLQHTPLGRSLDHDYLMADSDSTQLVVPNEPLQPVANLDPETFPFMQEFVILDPESGRTDLQHGSANEHVSALFSTVFVRRGLMYVHGLTR